MAADTILRLYSMTKPIVCTALMTLVEEGRLTLVDAVAKHLPAFASVKVRTADGSLVDPIRPMTVGDLLAHTSGLTYHFLGDSPVSKMYDDALVQRADVPLAEAIDDLARFPLAAHPGSRWIYSVGIDVAARLIEVVAGKPLGDVLRERLFEPLGMIDTAFGVAAGALGRLAAMYGRPDLLRPGVTSPGSLVAWAQGENQRVDVSRTYPTDRPEVFQRGGHGLFGTTADYFRFAQDALRRRKVRGTSCHRPKDAGIDARQSHPAGAAAARDRRPPIDGLRLRARLARACCPLRSAQTAVPACGGESVDLVEVAEQVGMGQGWRHESRSWPIASFRSRPADGVLESGNSKAAGLLRRPRFRVGSLRTPQVPFGIRSLLGRARSGLCRSASAVHHAGAGSVDGR